MRLEEAEYMQIGSQTRQVPPHAEMMKFVQGQTWKVSRKPMVLAMVIG
jgi:hypothetical protein